MIIFSGLFVVTGPKIDIDSCQIERHSPGRSRLQPGGDRDRDGGGPQWRYQAVVLFNGDRFIAEQLPNDALGASSNCQFVPFGRQFVQF